MTTSQIALKANVTNNAMLQGLRRARWSGARDSLWSLVDPLLPDGGSVAIVGAGSGDDVPLARISARASTVELIDIDVDAMHRAVAAAGPDSRACVTAREHDVTGGCAEAILQAASIGDDHAQIDPPTGPLGAARYDLVIGDMLYTQLLHGGLLALGIHGTRQHELMRRHDPSLTSALVQRIQASVASGGSAIHVHDVACWSSSHRQRVAIAAMLRRPNRHWPRLRRHDACDPHLALAQLGVSVQQVAWWHWPFEPAKQFVVRASISVNPSRAQG